MSNFMSVNATAPIVQQPTNTFHELLNPSQQTYLTSIQRGFSTAKITIAGSLEYLLNWFDNGLARHMTALGPDGGLAWEGYVTKMVLSAGALQYSHSLNDMANRVIVQYTQVDTANPPNETPDQSVTKNDTESQAQFGIKTRILNGDKATSTGADTLALTELARLAYPLRGSSVKTVAGKTPQLVIDCRGYAFMADWFHYEQTASSSTDTATNVIAAVLAADPNSVLSSDTLFMDTNSTDTETYWKADLAWSTIRAIIGRGANSGGSGQPWAGGIFADRKLVLKAAERLDVYNEPLSTNQYPRIFRDITQGDGVLTDENGKPVEPWKMRPDRIVVASRLNRAMYVNLVNYTPPYNLTLQGDDDLFQFNL